MLKNIIFSEITFVILDIALGSLMAFIGVLAYGKTRKISGLFFVISSLFMYLNMIFRVLEILNIFFLKNLTLQGIPVYFFVINDLPLLFMIFGFIFILREK